MLQRLAWIAVFTAAAIQPATACRLERRATVPFERAGGLFIVAVAVNGIAARFVLDTGAERSVVGLEAAERLHLARDEWVSTDILGVGGRDRRRLGRPQSLTIGGLALRRRTLAADNSVVVGPIPTKAGGQPIDGLLGQDYLSAFDLDIDAVAGTVTLYAVADCSGRFLPWAGGYTAIAAWRPVRNILAVPLQIGASRLQAELDTGAASSVITQPGMVELGLSAGGPDTVSGFGANHLAAGRTHFASVQVGPLPATAADFAVAPVHTMRSIGALLGADWFASRHVWISWSTDTVFVAAAL